MRQAATPLAAKAPVNTLPLPVTQSDEFASLRQAQLSPLDTSQHHQPISFLRTHRERLHAGLLRGLSWGHFYLAKRGTFLTVNDTEISRPPWTPSGRSARPF